MRLSLLTIECGLTLISVALAFCCPRAGSRFFRKVESTFGRLARRQSLSVMTVGALAAMLRLLILPLLPVPQPFAMGDFSYLLASQTFASGHFANPGHPMWAHLESFHVTLWPSYMSMYFPGQGALMAVGSVVAGHPWYGVLASCALMCSAICWMLQGWLPPGWALLGGMLAVLRIGLFSYWIDSYYGGALPALAGALVLGSLPRIRQSFRTREFFWLALGMALLASTRPYEGLLICIPTLLVVAWHFGKSTHPPPLLLMQRIAPSAALLIATVGLLGFYNYRVFGKALTTPYKLDRDMYASAPHFVFQAARPQRTYRHKEMRDFYTGLELSWYEEMQTPQGFLKKTVRKLASAMTFYLGTILVIPLIMLPKALGDRRVRFLVVTAAVVTVGLVAETWFLPHYLAPFTAGIYVVLLQCMRHMRASWRRGTPGGLFIVRAIPVACMVLATLRVCAGPLQIALPGGKLPTAYGSAPLGLARARVEKELESVPGKQLAIVRYAPGHDVYEEWVYNRASIDTSKVVWARDMDARSNEELLRYYKDRNVWLVEADCKPPKIVSLSVAQESQSHYLAVHLRTRDSK